MKKLCLITAASILLAVFLYSGSQALRQWSEYRAGEETYRELSEYVALPRDMETVQTDRIAPQASAEAEAAASTSEPAAESADFSDIQWPQVDFDELQRINPDIVAWLYCPDTLINYPVVQAEDNRRYLTHMFDGRTNSAGCIFADAGNSADFTDPHTIVYGHNLKSGKMFGQLCLYKEQSYYEAHPRMLLLTREAGYVVEIFSGHVASASSDAWQLTFEGDSEFQGWLERAVQKSLIQSEVQPTAEDTILTLSTCSYEFTDARFVLHGILRRAK